MSATNGDLLETSAATKQNLYSQRAITEVEREEMIVVIRDVFEANGTLKTEDAVRAVARKLGFARAGARIDEAIRKNLSLAVRRRILINERGTYTIYRRQINNYKPEELMDALLGAIGRGWIEHSEAVRLAAHWLSFQRTGSAIRAAFKPIFNGAIRRDLLEYEGSRIRRLG